MSVCSTGLGELDFLAGRIVVSPNDAMRALDCGRTTLYALIGAGELESYVEGKARKITVASIIALVNRRLEAARADKAA